MKYAALFLLFLCFACKKQDFSSNSTPAPVLDSASAKAQRKIVYDMLGPGPKHTLQVSYNDSNNVMRTITKFTDKLSVQTHLPAGSTAYVSCKDLTPTMLFHDTRVSVSQYDSNNVYLKNAKMDYESGNGCSASLTVE
jgi:hypothetical protein